MIVRFAISFRGCPPFWRIGRTRSGPSSPGWGLLLFPEDPHRIDSGRTARRQVRGRRCVVRLQPVEQLFQEARQVQEGRCAGDEPAEDQQAGLAEDRSVREESAATSKRYLEQVLKLTV